MEKLLQKYQSLEMNELHSAVQGNRLDAVKCLVRNGADIASTIKSGQTPLHLAAKLNYQLITQELLKNKSREKMRNVINRRTLDTGTAALHLAVGNNSLQITRFLLSRGANFEVQDYQNRQPKHLTTDKRILQLIDRIEMVFESTPASDSKILLEKLNFCSGENVEAVLYARNRQDFTSLQFAMEKNHLDAVATIISFRIDQLKQDDWKASGDFDKLMRYSKAVKRYLSNLDTFCHENENGLVVDSYVKKDVLDVLRNAHEFLTAYKEKGDVELHDQPLLIIVEESLQFFGSWKKSQFTENKRVDLMLRKGPAFVAKMLQLCIGAPVKFFMRLVYTMELLKAARGRDVALVEKCLTGHPDVNMRNTQDRTAMHYAVDVGKPEIIELLLNFGADLTSTSKRDNMTILHYISSHRFRHLWSDIGSLLRATYNNLLSNRGSLDGINAQRASGHSTALHVAVHHNNPQLVSLFLAQGANYCAKDTKGETPKDYCRYGPNSLEYLEPVDRLFAQARNGQIEELIQTMRELKGHKLLACGGARDDKGHTLDQVLELKGHVDAAKQIRDLLEGVEWV